VKTIFKFTISKILLIVLFLYSLFGFIVLPYLIQSNFTKVIKENLDTNGYLSRVYINPFTFKLELHNLLIQDDKHKTLLYFKSLETDFELLELMLKEIELDYLEIDSLKTSVTLYENETFNFKHILNHLNQAKDEKHTKETKTNDSELIFTINELLLKNTRIRFTDKTKSKTFQIKTKPFDFTMEDFSTKHNTTATIISDIDIVDTARLHLSSNFILAPLQVKGDISLQQLQLEKIYSYLEDNLDFQFKGVIQNISSSFQMQSVNDLLKFNIEDIKLKSDDIFLTDLITNKDNTLKFQKLNINIDKVTSNKQDNSHIKISVNTPKSGKVITEIDIKQDPLKIEGITTLQQVDISAYKDYIKNFINIDLRNSLVDIDAKFNLDEKHQDVQANIVLSDIDLFHQLTKKRLLTLDTLNIEGLKYTNNDLFIDNIQINTFNTSLLIDKNQKTNIDNLLIVKKEKKNIQKNKTEKQKSDFHYYVKSLTISNGTTVFADHSLPLNFNTKIHTLSATVNDISSKNKKTEIKLTGTIDKYGQATIDATSLLSNFKNKTDVVVKFENLDVKSFSPYSGKFIGQKIADGRLSLDLNYNINDAQLSSTNNIKIKDLTLGEDVKSKDALSLPVGLAIALLEDSDGLIDLDVPVVGDMSNPSFQLSGVIWKTLGNVITNIVTAPFKFLGSLLGLDSDELGHIEFNFAQSKILPPQKEKLDKLISVLKKKKKLTIILQPTINILKDTKKLQEIKFLELIKSDNKEETIKNIYQKRFGKDKLEILLSKNKKEDYMKLLSNEITNSLLITKEELNKLAINRANNLKAYFVSNKLTLDRIQIKKNVFESKDTKSKNLSLKLELNIKE